ncbi:MAG TPA: hypothetical protein VG432_04770 [Gemmatimonadaceae bacterium]|nr:hypothetical protein [Gemmatimonadaceae bacterium]
MSHAGKLRLTVVALLGAAAVASCRDRHKAPTAPPADTVAQLDTQTTTVAPPDPPKPALSPLADTIAERLVFPPRGQLWFTAAARGKRMLVDIGRVDLDVKQEPRASAFVEAVTRLSPVPIGARFRLSGPWGADSAVLKEFSSWNGRIVGVLEVAPRVDSLARTVEPLPAAAAITDSAVVSVTDSCRRDSLGEDLADRASIVRDSISQQLLETAKPPFERLQNSLKVSSSRIAGCYGRLGRVLVIVSARAGNTEWVAERMAIVDDTGAVTPLRFSDYRFDAHDGVYAFDADRDGVDDLATRALGEAMGGLSVMRLDTARKRLDRLTAGFSWESR